jgi:penicillin-binding protein 1A
VLRLVFKIIVLIIVIALGTATGAYFALIRGVPQIEDIKYYVPSNPTQIFADDDTLIGEFRVEKGEYVSLDKIPEYLLRAVIAVEDSRFWYHSGVDYFAIARALIKDISAGRIKQGASTITQQLAKVVFLSPERTVIRKLREAVLARRLEENLSKEEILELYLNKIYYGHGAYGIEMAARTYFGKSVSDVTLGEAAMLSGLIKAPSRYSPYSNLKRAKERQKTVLNRMIEEGYITDEQAEAAIQQPLYLSSVKYRKYTPNYFLEYVRKYLEDEYGVEMTYKGGLKVYTTLNRQMQMAAVASVKKGLRRLDKRQGFRGPIGHKDLSDENESTGAASYRKVVLSRGDIMTATVIRVRPGYALVRARGNKGKLLLKDASWAKKLIDEKGNIIKKFRKMKLTDILKPGDIITVRVKDPGPESPLFALEQEPLVQGALIAIEPSTGFIRAIVGGYDFNKSEFNRAVYARRQAGSAFKPMIFAAAMDHGYTPATLIPDQPLLYESEEFGNWEPENYDEKYHGLTRIREALIHSRNIPTVKLLEEMGVEKAIRFARKLGIQGPFPHNLTLALGSLSTSPLEITSAFAVFANDGVRMKPQAIKYIMDAENNVIENNQPSGRRVITEQTAFLATSMLEDVVRHGTGWRARALNRHVAGKTGTTNEYNDAWYIGYTPELAAGVWVGFDSVRSLGDEETGSRAAAPIWVAFMKKALAEMSALGGSPGRDKGEPFHIPENIVTAVIDPLTGLLATNETGKMVEFFKEGSVPKLYSTEFYRNLVRLQKEALSKIKKDKNDDGTRTLSN